jgi:EpsI family protein
MHEPMSATEPDAQRPRDARWPTVVVCALLVATGLLGWSFTLRPALAVDTAPLDAFPIRFDAWHGEEIPIEDDVTELLDADFNLQRIYEAPLGEFVWLYIGYYGTDRGGHTPHTPWVCYPSAGWEIVASDTLALGTIPERRVNELVVELGDDRRLVHFWYRSHRATGIVSEWGWQVDRMLGRLLDGRADGGLVRVSTPIIEELGGIERSRALLRAFGTEADALLERHWPEERAVSG